MKQTLWWLFGILFTSLIILGPISAEAAVTHDERYVGLHDRILPISDVPVVDSNTRVPLDEIGKFLYLPIKIEDGVLHIRKRGIDYTYDYATKETKKDGVVQISSPIVERNNKLYITVTYIAEELGFKVHYFPEQKTLRIYRDDYKHMSHEDFKRVIQKHKQPETAAKANVYLTFDDGPNQFTASITKTLQKHGLKGTFFFVGNQLKAHPQIARDTANAGHAIGSHSVTHDKNKVYQSPEGFMAEMNQASRMVREITGIDSRLIRVPYGSKPFVTANMRNRLANHSYRLWDWDVDSEDWKYTDAQADQILRNVQKGVKRSYAAGNRDIVILLHDRSQTAKVLPVIIEWLQKEGYTMKRYDPKRHLVKNFYSDKRL